MAMNKKKPNKDAAQIRAEKAEEKKPSGTEGFFKYAIRRVFRHKLAVVGIVVFSIFILTSLLAPLISTHSITDQNLRNRFAPPTFQRILPTGIAQKDGVFVSSTNTGEVFATDTVFGMPAWFLSLDEAMIAPPVLSLDKAYFGTESGFLGAYGLDRGTEEWTTTIDETIKHMWQVEPGVMVLGDERKLYYFGPDGTEYWAIDIGENILKEFYGFLDLPYILTDEGNLYVIEDNGNKDLLYTFTDQVPKIAYAKGQTIYFYTENHGLYEFDLEEGSKTHHITLDDIEEQPVQIMGHGDKIMLSYTEGITLVYSLSEEKVLWQTEFRGEMINMFPGDGNKMHSVWSNGRLRELNVQTGGTLGSRMVQGYSDIHYLGTDELGRDVFSRILYGGRVSISLGIIVSLLSVSIGSVVGAMSGYFGGITDHLIMRFVDFMLSLPLLPMLMIFAYLLGPGFQTMVIVLVLFGWMVIARVVRSQALSLKQQDFTEAARALGASSSRIIGRHILPNTMAPMLVAATLAVGTAILSESQLSYLGLGIQPPMPSWGNMLYNARQYLTTAPWLAVWPGLCIFLTLLSINFFGDGLRDALDPKLKGKS